MRISSALSKYKFINKKPNALNNFNWQIENKNTKSPKIKNEQSAAK